MIKAFLYNNKEKISKLELAEMLLLIVIGFHIVSNIVWISANKAPTPPDPSNHTVVAVQIRDCIISYPKTHNLWCFSPSTFYPPFAHTIVALLMLVTGNAIMVGAYVNVLFFTLTMGAIYLWTKEFYKDKMIALFTVALVSFIPEVYNFTRHFWLEIPLFGLIYLILYFLLKSDGFKDKKYTLLAFLFIAFAILTKWSAVGYLIAPGLFTLIKSFKENGFMTTLMTLLKGAVIVLFIAGPWYIVFYKSVFFYGFYASFFTPIEGTKTLVQEVQGWLTYFTWFINFGFGFMLSCLLGVFGIFYFKHASKLNKIYVMAFLISAYVAFTLIASKDPRYVVPLLPIPASILIYALHKAFKDKTKIKIGFLVVIAGFLLLQYFKFSYDIPHALNIRKAVKLPVVGWVDIYNISLSYPAQPYYNDVPWPNDQIIDDMYQLADGRTVKLLQLIEHKQMNNRNMFLLTLLKKYNNVLINDDFPFNHLDGFKNDEEIIEYLKTKNYVLVPQHETSTDFYKFKPVLSQIQRVFFERDTSSFAKLVKTYVIPYGELNAQILNERNPAFTGGRYDNCKTERCDKLFLYEIFDNVTSVKITDDYTKVSYRGSVPVTCATGMCDLIITIPASGWTRVNGSPLIYAEENWPYNPTNSEGSIWIFYNKSDKPIEIKIQGWAGGNATNSFVANDAGKVDSLVLNDLKMAFLELKTPGNCTSFGCATIGYTVWDCTAVGENNGSGECTLTNRFNPVQNGVFLPAVNHDEIFGKVVESSESK